MTVEAYLLEVGQKAKQAKSCVAKLGQLEKNKALNLIAQAMLDYSEEILKENQKDILNAREKRMKESLVDRLLLTKERIESMAEGVRQISELEDPVGEMKAVKVRPNGLSIGEKVVPLGVVGIIYESRPNVTSDAFALCFKTNNAVILRGGSDAIHSNKAIVTAIQTGLLKAGIDQACIQLIERTDRETAREFMKLNQYIDVLIPRGGEQLIQTVVKESTVPVIETGTGNCHVYVDKDGDVDMAVSIIENAKTQRYGVCNACESLVIHRAILEKVIGSLVETLTEKGVEIRGDNQVCALEPSCVLAKAEDWGTEYLDKIISIKTVDSLDEAIQHINQYNTGHSEAIITENYQAAMRFLEEIDAAAVYVNASTRFTDGFEFGFGAEIGISTQKLHARGPMGLSALTTTKYVIFGNGQIRS